MRAAVAPTTVPEEMRWTKCPSCGAFVYYKRLERNLKVCPECNFHFRISVEDRLAQLLDEGSFTDLGSDIRPVDALGFVDSKPYPTRLIEAQRKTGRHEGAVFGTGTIAGSPIVVAIMDFQFMGGSMGGGVGEAISRAAEYALATHTPLLVIASSGGARMQEGCISLMQMVKTSQAVARLREEGVLYISLLTDPTYGGVSASFASLGDILIAEPNTHVGFAGPQVIEQTIRQELPPGFQMTDFLMDHGMLDLVEPRENMRRTLGRLLKFYTPPGYRECWSGLVDAGALLPSSEGRALIADPGGLTDAVPWDVVQLARNIDRPNTLEYIARIFEDFEELHGDRLFDDDAAIVGGPARLGDLTVMIIGHQKGHTTSEMVERNFGMPNPEGYRKALRLMHHAARFGMPIVTLVDTPGAYPGIGAEERGQSIAIAEAILDMSRLPVPIVTTVIGEGGSGGALAMAVGDRVLMLQNAYYSVISPEGCSVILWKNAAAAPQAAAALRLTAPDLLRLGIVDGVVPEPDGGAHTDLDATAANLKAGLVSCLAELVRLSPDDLLEQRYSRFRTFGTPASAGKGFDR